MNIMFQRVFWGTMWEERQGTPMWRENWRM